MTAVAALGAAGCGGGSGGQQTYAQAAKARTATSTTAAVAPPAVQHFSAGQNPHDLAVAGGKVWVADFGGPVREFDLHGHQLKRIGLDAQSMAAGGGSV